MECTKRVNDEIPGVPGATAHVRVRGDIEAEKDRYSHTASDLRLSHQRT